MKSKIKKKKVVFFEDIMPVFNPFIMFYLWRGYQIYVFDFNYNLKKQKWLRHLINNEKIKRIYIKPNTKEHGDAIDQTGAVYSHFKETRLPQIVASLYQSNDMHIVFKKALVGEIFKCIYINSYLSRIEKAAANSETLLFVPKDYRLYENLIKNYGSYPISPLTKVKISIWAMPFMRVFHIYEKIKYSLEVLFYTLTKAVLLAFGKLRKNKVKKIGNFKYVIPIDTFFQIMNSGERGFDFLLDNAEINTGNTVFILNISLNDNLLKPYKEKGYIFLKSRDIYGFHNLIKTNYEHSFIITAIMSARKILRCWDAPAVFIKTFFISLRVFINWNLIFKHVSFENYIYTHQTNVGQSAINIMVKKQGGRSWNYASFVGGGYISSNGEDFDSHRNILWSFLCFDYYIGVNKDVISYYKLHHQSVKKYYSVGSIYSEMIPKNMMTGQRTDFISNHFRHNVTDKTKIISFFDTSFVDSPDAPTTFQDCIGFYQDILRFLTSKEELLIIIKPSKAESWFIRPDFQWSSPKKGRAIVNLWNTLKFHPRVFWTRDSRYEKDLDFTYNNIAIAMSDLVVTHCTSSPTAEALGARKRAIWYESSDKHRGLIYDKIPGLCAHGYNELVERAEYLLYEITDKEYNEYLDKHIRGKVESHLDGLGLTKFRQLLIGKGILN